MVSQAWIDAQPKQYNFLRINAFKLVLHPLPKVSYFGQTANIPGITSQPAIQPTPLKNLAVVGDKASYDNFSIEFILDEDMENWAELVSWMKGLYFPDSNEEFYNLRVSGQMKKLSNLVLPTNEESGVYADATLFLLDSNNNPTAKVFFKDTFPISMSGIQLDSKVNEISYLTCTAEFAFKSMDIDIA